jgi:hypothetical protein
MRGTKKKKKKRAHSMVACTCAVYCTILPCPALPCPARPIIDLLFPPTFLPCLGLRLLQRIQRWHVQYLSAPDAYRSEGLVQYLAGWLLDGESWRVRCWARMGRISGGLSSGPHLRIQCHLRRRTSDIRTPTRGPHWLSAKSLSPRRLGQGGPMEERPKARPSSWDAHAESPA